MPKSAVKKGRKKASAAKKTSRTRKPENLSLEEWQIALRREYGQAQTFSLKNLGDEPFFSEYAVTNPASERTYRVVVRGEAPGMNFCSCPDFTVNTLGTCKHIEWTVAKLKHKRGGKKAFREGHHADYSEVYLEYGAQRRVRFNQGRLFPSDMKKFIATYFDEFGALRASEFDRFPKFMRELAGFDHEVRVYDDVLEFVGRVRDAEALRRNIDRAFARTTPTLNGLLKTKLYPYQQQGALFAARAGRALLADDMGLGKTIQAIGAVEILAKAAGAQRVLVVCPAALKYQWQQEVERFTNRSAQAVFGLSHERKEQYKEDSFYKIINYEIVHRDLDMIHEWGPDVIILDEAQRIKNWQTRRANAVKQLQSDYAIVLTGTPLENRLEELYSIMQFVDRFHLGPLFRFLHNHQYTDESGRVIGYRDLNRIQESLAPVLLRRHKDEVLRELPERTDKHFFVDMTREQWSIHEENQSVVAKIVFKWRRFGFLSESDQRRLMVALQMMRMVCNSTYLVDHETDNSRKMDECMALLADLLETPENKAVVFSQWLRTHELLIRRLDKAGIDYGYYHGSLDQRKRRTVLERFKTDPACRVLLCSDSGGVGLNLQEAAIVINMDQPWNPAILEQRIGRVHRLGQQRNVQVYHFVARGAIEHNMLDVIKFKRSVFKGVLDGGETEVFLGGAKMKKFMETVEQVSAQAAEQPPMDESETETPDIADEAVEATPDTAVETPAKDATVAPDAAAAAQEATQPQGWDALINAGAAFIGALAETLQQPQDADRTSRERQALSPAALLARDEKTGAPQLRIPLPDPETANKLADMMTLFGNVMRNISADQKNGGK